MRSLILLIILIMACALVYAQPSDFISVRKRNNRTLKTYFPGSLISFQSVYSNYHSGIIQAIHHDSIFIRQYDVRSVLNQWGVAKVDTLASYLVAIHYKDIDIIRFDKKASFEYVKNGTLMMIGGIGYIGLNLINGKYLKEPLSDTRNRRSLAITLGVTGSGFALNRFKKYSNRNGKRYRVIYVRMDGRQSV